MMNLPLFSFLLFFISGFSPSIQQPYSCYQCASNSVPECADPANVSILKTKNVINGCAGACIVYKLSGTVYRGCTSNTTLSGLIGTASTNSLTYSYCKINLCNYLAPPASTSTVAPAALPSSTVSSKPSFNCYSCNSNTPGCDNPFNGAGLPTISCQGACVIYATDKLYRGCTNLITSGGSGTYLANTVKMNYCSTNLCNTGSAPNPTTTIATTTLAPGIKCYSCNSATPGCGNPFSGSGLSQITCQGACLVWISPYDNKLYRGCTNKIPITTNPTNGIVYVGNIGMNYCQTNLCNTGLAPLPPTTTPTTTTATTTIPPWATSSPTTIPTATIPTTTSSTASQATSSSQINCLNDPSNLVSWEEFSSAVTQSGYPQPTETQYCNYVTQLASAGGITSKTEAAMFLAQILWESAGLTAMREFACVSTNCPNDYNSKPAQGLYYYGRGYIQLSWDYNYRAASQALFGDDRLVTNPDLVASDDKIAWATAFWYWKANVGTDPNVKAGYFGSSTRRINGALECGGGYESKARARYNVYKVVFAAYNLPGSPIENGCYN